MRFFYLFSFLIDSYSLVYRSILSLYSKFFFDKTELSLRFRQAKSTTVADEKKRKEKKQIKNKNYKNSNWKWNEGNQIFISYFTTHIHLKFIDIYIYVTTPYLQRFTFCDCFIILTNHMIPKEKNRQPLNYLWFRFSWNFQWRNI